MFVRLVAVSLRINWRLFGLTMGVGLLCGAFVGGLKASAAPAAHSESASQQNYLLVLVEDAQSEESELLALWLVASTVGSGQVSWMPIYPEPFLDTSGEYAGTHEAVMVNTQDIASIGALAMVREQGPWWDGILVLDSSGLDIVASAVGASIGSINSSTWQEPQSALREQVFFIQAVCDKHAELTAEGVLDQILLTLSEAAHLRSNLSLFEVIKAWDAFSTHTQLHCNHPWAN
jgi:hypothetical protein